MTSLIEEHRSEIEKLCRQFSVRHLQLFGSAASGEFDLVHSDLDFFVEFRDSDHRGSSDRYFGLLHGLEDLFRRRIDLVDPAMVKSRIFLDISRQHVEELYHDATAAQTA